jgi:SAM-dependent methyltransferase
LTEATDILHVAPELGLTQVLRRAKRSRTVSIDLKHPLADRRMDVRSIEFPDSSFDVAICSHVLEHVFEDRQVMAELYRVLAPGEYCSRWSPGTGRPRRPARIHA